MTRAERTRRRFPPSSAVVIKDECIVDIDLPCRTEEPRSFLQHSFIIVTGWEAITCASTHARAHSLENTSWKRSFASASSSHSTDSSEAGCWDTAAGCCTVSSSPSNDCTFYNCHMSWWRRCNTRHVAVRYYKWDTHLIFPVTPSSADEPFLWLVKSQSCSSFLQMLSDFLYIFHSSSSSNSNHLGESCGKIQVSGCFSDSSLCEKKSKKKKQKKRDTHTHLTHSGFPRWSLLLISA